MNFSDLPKHHAILIKDSNRKESSTTLFNELQKASLVHRLFDQTVLDIDTARDIISWAKIPYDSEKVAVISFHSIGIEAQNAMLKILEEPPNQVRFVLCTGNTDILVPTFLSRVCQVESHGTVASEKIKASAKLFLETQYGERMKLPYVVFLLKQKDEKGRKEKENVRLFILSLVDQLPRTKENSSYIEELLTITSFSSDSSSSSKALLEYLSLLLPQMKV